MPFKTLIWFFLIVLLNAQQSAFCQQIINGNFDGKPIIGFESVASGLPTTLNQQLSIHQLGSDGSVFFRLVNYPAMIYTPQDSATDLSKGALSWLFLDSSDTDMFHRTIAHPEGIFRDGFLLGPRTQFNSIPFHNRLSVCFIHFNIKKYGGPQYKYGYSSIKLSINYSSALSPGKKYLITIFDMALDSVSTNQFEKTQLEDSLFIGSALNDNSIGDTIAITHPQRGVWNKRFIPFTPTKPYTHFTIGNYSAESANIAANMIDECYIFSIQSTSADTLKACPGDSVWMQPYVLMHKTEWGDGDTIAGRFVSKPGWNIRYSYPDTNSVLIDSFFLVYTMQPGYRTNTTACENQTLVLRSSYNSPSASYTWSTGDISSSIITLAGNTIWCRAQSPNGCTITDSFFITRLPVIQVQLSADSILCYGQSKTIGVTPETGKHYLWNTSDTLPQLTIHQSGKYTLTVSNGYCSDSASLNVTAKGLIRINLPADTVFCFDDLQTLLLDAGDAFTSYLWKPTGERTPSIYATMPQRYIVLVKDSSNCDGSGSTLVSETCPDFVFVPNAFTPNGDGLNDVFLPQTRNLSSYQLNIVNRWGEIIFTTKNPQQGWDGKDAPADVYVVLINYKVDGKEQQSVNRNVSLLR